jgi:protein-S-isoprenylcysteine O-methyltransferase Ste14
VSILAQVPLTLLFWPPRPGLRTAASGAACLLFGVALNVWAERLFRRDGVGVCPFSPVPRLVRSGPYRLTRNPMYLGFVLLSAGVALVTGVPANLWSAAVFAAWLHLSFVLPEEAYLREQLGSEYDDYQRDHPRWLGLGSSWRVPPSELPTKRRPLSRHGARPSARSSSSSSAGV